MTLPSPFPGVRTTRLSFIDDPAPGNRPEQFRWQLRRRWVRPLSVPCSTHPGVTDSTNSFRPAIAPLHLARCLTPNPTDRGTQSGLLVRSGTFASPQVSIAG